MLTWINRMVTYSLSCIWGGRGGGAEYAIVWNCMITCKCFTEWLYLRIWISYFICFCTFNYVARLLVLWECQLKVSWSDDLHDIVSRFLSKIDAEIVSHRYILRGSRLLWSQIWSDVPKLDQYFGSHRWQFAQVSAKTQDIEYGRWRKYNDLLWPRDDKRHEDCEHHRCAWFRGYSRHSTGSTVCQHLAIGRKTGKGLELVHAYKCS